MEPIHTLEVPDSKARQWADLVERMEATAERHGQVTEGDAASLLVLVAWLRREVKGSDL